MAFHPVPFDIVSLCLLIEALPKVDVFNRCLVRCFPVLALPAVDPLSDALAHVLAVCRQRHLAGGFQGFQTNDSRQ